MEGIIAQLARQEVWEEFLSHRLLKGRFTWHEFDDADQFVAAEQYRPVVERLLRGEALGIPRKQVLNNEDCESHGDKPPLPHVQVGQGLEDDGGR